MAGAKSVENSEPFNRFVSLALKARLRNLKKQVLDDLGMGDMCSLRVRFFETFESSPSQEEEKPSEKEDDEVA